MVSQSVNGTSENHVNFAVPESVIESTWDEVFAAASRDAAQARFLLSWSSGEGRIVDSLTFHELYSRGLAVAVRLRSLSAQPGDGIALLSHPSVELYVCVVGVFALGAHCVNLNWRQPASVLARAVVETTGARFLVASYALRRLADAIDSTLKDDALRALPYARFELLGAADAGSRVANGAPGLMTGPLLPEEAALVHHESPLAAVAPSRDLPFQNVAAEGVSRISSHRDALEPALVMFTSGSTGKPKGVPITHKGALWACRTKLDAHDGIDNVRPNGTLSFLPNFHVIGFINNFLFNALCRVPCSVHAEAPTAILTAEIFALAASHLQPEAVDTVPAILEALGREAIERGTVKGRALLSPFARAKMVSCGGAPLSSAAYDALSQMGVAVVPHYGQTELGGGFCLMGRPRAGRDLMRPVRGVRVFILADGEPRIETPSSLDEVIAKHDLHDNDAPIFGAEQGEAIVLGCGSATPGYARQPKPVVPFAQCRSTGDVFQRVVGADGVVWLRHVCRRDDVIIHATGELTNPLPMEDAALRALGQHAKRVAVVGQKRPSPIMFVEESYTGAREGMDISSALAVANESAPAYSRISSTRVIVIEPGGIPVSGKGNVVRSQLELKYEAQMDALDVELARLEESLNSLSATSKRQTASRRYALTSMPVEDVRKIVLASAKELIGTADLPSDAPLLSAGLNSTGLVQLVSVLSDKLSIPDLKPTLIFDHPSVDAVVAFVTSAGEEKFLDGNDRRGLNGEPPQVAAPNVASQVLRSPPNVRTARDFAARGAALFDAVSVVPLRKWDIEAVETSTERLPTHAAASVRYGAFLDPEIEGSFDSTLFRCKRIEVNAMDPQQRLLLDVGYEALHDSGYDRRSLMDAEIGTFTGALFSLNLC